MYSTKRLIWYIVLLGIGISLFIAGCAEWIPDFWAGFGGGLVGVSAVRLIYFHRYRTDESYKKAADTAARDERNQFIMNTARSWTFYFSFLALAVLCVVFQIVGLPLYSRFCSFTVCGMMMIYWLCWLVARRKY